MTKTALHTLLQRQIKHHIGSPDALPNGWDAFVSAIDSAYQEFDNDREILERSLELSSQELLGANIEMRAVFEAIPDMLFRIDFQGKILSMKAGAGLNLVVPTSNFIGTQIQEFHEGNVGKLFDLAIPRVAEKAEAVIFEYTIPRDQGGGSYEARMVPALDRQIVVIVRSITDRKREDELRHGQSEALGMIATGSPLHEIMARVALIVEAQVDRMHCAVMLMDEKGTSLRLCASPSIPPELSKIIGTIPVQEGAGACGTAAFRRELVAIPDTRLCSMNEEWRAVAIHNNIHACWSAPVFAQDGRVLGTFALFSNAARKPTPQELETVSQAARIAGIAIERKQAESALSKAEEKYRNIVEHAVEGIFQFSPEGHIVEANPAFAHVLGYDSPKDLKASVTDVVYQLFAEAERFSQFARLIEEQGLAQRFSARMQRKDGAVIWVELNARLVRAPDGTVLFYEGIAEDTTEHKRLEEQFLQAQKMEAFGRLAGGVAHDFNNLLTVIQGNVALLDMTPGANPDNDTALSEINRASERAAALTRQLLTFSRRQPFLPRDIDMNETVSGMMRMLQRLIGEDVKLESVPSQGKAPVQADPGMMEQAIMNLVVNSRDAMPKGGRITLGVKSVELSQSDIKDKPRARPGVFIKASVSDTGSGINPEHMAHIFEPFFTTKEVGRGTGLGLATVFSIVEQHQGWIEVESVLGSGSTFSFFLPKNTKRSKATDTSAPFPVSNKGKDETILLVEDDSAVRELVRRILERNSYIVLVATNGPEALTLWGNHRNTIDLVISDIVMPEGINGHELAARLRLDRPELKVIHCTGYSEELAGRNIALPESTLLLEKPFDLRLLLQHVRNLLDA